MFEGLQVETLDRLFNASGEVVGLQAQGGAMLGVGGTPAFFINGRHHQGAYDTATLSAAVRAARTRSRLREKAAGQAASQA